jgi:predicted acyl esterase
VYVTDVAPGTVLDLIGSGSNVVKSGTTDSNGSLIFRDVPVGEGYTVVGHDNPALVLGPVSATAMDDPPDASFYENQAIGRGYGYFQTRDGTLLAINVVLPGPAENGPYPTVIEYSGYDPANPDSNQPSTLISTVLGYAAVGVNIRGTGCSGGAFQFFEPLQSTDGYDAVEAIAAQPWVLNHQVGMVGISYPGISQLFVAQLQPPHLAAIAPLSVVADTGRGTLYPGGILNNGFATDWAKDRQHDAMPGGQAWSQKRMNEGDQVCINNMKLRGQTPDILQMIAENEFYNPAVADPVSPVTFVHKINVPVFLAGAFQDEQTGGYFATMLDHFTGTDKKHFTIVNGNHTEPLIPVIFHRWIEFLSFYVRKEIPQTPSVAQAIVNVIGDQIYKVSGLTLPPDRFTTAPSYEAALALYEQEPQLRVLFESGAGGASPGAPVPAFEYEFAGWPVPGLEPTAWYFGDGGSLVPELPTGDEADSYIYDPSGSQRTTYTGNSDGIWAALPAWDWQPLTDGEALAYATAPLTADTVMIGSGSVDLWLRATAPDVDLQVTLSEIRPDGQESYVISGWLRASRRKLDEAVSTELRPLSTHLEEDAAPLPADEFVLARVEIFPFAYAFRTGSRIRISIEAPGGDRPLWKFMALPAEGEVTVDVARSAAFPSRVVLPVVPGISVPTLLPACPSLRGEPCRTYVELDNTPAGS